MNLNVAVLPLNIMYGNPTVNLEAVASSLQGLRPGTDVVVLPELFSSSFVSDSNDMHKLAEGKDGVVIRTLKGLAAKYGCALAGSFAAKDDEKGGKIYNRAFFIEPGGDTSFYDKHHLFTPSNEAMIFTAGASRCKLIRFRGWNIRLIVCYDLRFPAWCRNSTGDYDVLICPANWGGAREYAFRHLIIGRAIENQAYVIGANRTGSDAYGDYPREMSLIVSPMGKIIHTDDGDGMMYAELDYEKMIKLRERFPALPDADEFTFNT